MVPAGSLGEEEGGALVVEADGVVEGVAVGAADPVVGAALVLEVVPEPEQPASSAAVRRQAVRSVGTRMGGKRPRSLFKEPSGVPETGKQVQGPENARDRLGDAGGRRWLPPQGSSRRGA
jgi:hypothetical protein